MHVLVIGSNGKVGRRLNLQLAGKGHAVRAMVRSPGQMEILRNTGIEPWLADLENDFSSAFEDMDVVVFTAGSGSHTGPEKTVDIQAVRTVQDDQEKGQGNQAAAGGKGAHDHDHRAEDQGHHRANEQPTHHLGKAHGRPPLIRHFPALFFFLILILPSSEIRFIF